MLLFSKFFENSITESDRIRLFNEFKIVLPEFVFAEIRSGMVVRAFKVVGTCLTPYFDPKVEADLETLCELPVVKLRHSGELGSGTPQKGLSLWEVLLPFPFRLFDPRYQLAGCEVHFSDCGLREQFHQLERFLAEMEKRFGQTEVSCLMIRGQNWKPVLLFHYVRKHLLKAAIETNREELWNEWQGLSVERAQQVFGTSVSFVEMDTSELPDKANFSSVYALFERALHLPGKNLLAGFSSAEALYFEL